MIVRWIKVPSRLQKHVINKSPEMQRPLLVCLIACALLNAAAAKCPPSSAILPCKCTNPSSPIVKCDAGAISGPQLRQVFKNFEQSPIQDVLISNIHGADFHVPEDFFYGLPVLGKVSIACSADSKWEPYSLDFDKRSFVSTDGKWILPTYFAIDACVVHEFDAKILSGMTSLKEIYIYSRGDFHWDSLDMPPMNALETLTIKGSDGSVAKITNLVAENVPVIKNLHLEFIDATTAEGDLAFISKMTTLQLINLVNTYSDLFIPDLADLTSLTGCTVDNDYHANISIHLPKEHGRLTVKVSGYFENINELQGQFRDTSLIVNMKEKSTAVIRQSVFEGPLKQGLHLEITDPSLTPRQCDCNYAWLILNPQEFKANMKMNCLVSDQAQVFSRGSIWNADPSRFTCCPDKCPHCPSALFLDTCKCHIIINETIVDCSIGPSFPMDNREFNSNLDYTEGATNSKLTYNLVINGDDWIFGCYIPQSTHAVHSGISRVRSRSHSVTTGNCPEAERIFPCQCTEGAHDVLLTCDGTWKHPLEITYALQITQAYSNIPVRMTITNIPDGFQTECPPHNN